MENNKKIKHISIPTTCGEDWSGMTPTEIGRFCLACQKEVIDFRKKSDAEIIAYLSKNANTCGRFHQKQLQDINDTLALSSPSSPRSPFSHFSAYYSTIGAWLFSSFSLLYASIAPAKAQISPQNDTLNVVNTSELEKQKQISGKKVTLKGQVVDEYGEPVIGATIFIESTAIGTVTNRNGYFSLEAEIGNTTIIVQSIGFASQKIKIESDALLNVILEEETYCSSGVVVVAGGIQVDEGIGNMYQEAGLPPKPTGYLDITPAFDWIGNLFKRNKK